MGVLKARVAGAWVDIGAIAPDVVWVDPSAPTDPSIELWYDTDATAYAPDTGPRGIVGRAVKTDAQNSIGTAAADVAGLSVPFTAVANRLYRLSAYLFVLPSASGSAIYTITDAANAALARGDIVPSTSGAHMAVSIWVTTAFAPGPITVKVRASTGAGTTNVNGAAAPCTLLVEDIGAA